MADIPAMVAGGRPKMKSNSVIQTSVNESIRTLTFNVIGAGEVTLHLERVAQANLDRATFHGFKQRIADAAALSRDEATGKPASPDEKLAAMKELVEWYESGSAEWSRRRAPGQSDIGLLWRAVCELKPGKDPAAIRESLAALKADEIRALLVNPKVKAIVDRIRSEATQGVDTEGLLEAI